MEESYVDQLLEAMETVTHREIFRVDDRHAVRRYTTAAGYILGKVEKMYRAIGYRE